MSFDFHWDDDAKTVMRYVAAGAWNWNDFHKHMRRSRLVFDQVGHDQPIEAIIDLSGGAKLPAGAVGHLRSLGKDEHPQRTRRVVIIGVDAATQAQLGAEDGAVQAAFALIRFVDSDDDARAVIAAWQASD